jgi:hypothetical protein
MVGQGEIVEVDFPVYGILLQTENAQLKVIIKEHVLIGITENQEFAKMQDEQHPRTVLK